MNQPEISIQPSAFLEIDGAMGEGGGQVLRTTLALAMCTGQPVRITHIRAGRKKPGLQQQHLTAVRAAGQISRAQVVGDKIGSTSLTFIPGEVQPGDYQFTVNTAGSMTLVLQTILYPLLLSQGKSHLTLTGGTHNPLAPPYDFLANAFLPVLNQMGPQISASLTRYGFYPKGGGQFSIAITPATRLSGFSLMERGKLIARQVKAIVAGIPEHVALRELQRITDKLGWSGDSLQPIIIPADQGPGNVLLIQLRHEKVTEVFTSFGQRGIAAEAVADHAIAMVRHYLATDVPVGEQLADQLLLPLALAGSGEFATVAPSSHTLTNIDVIKQFLPVSITTTKQQGETWVVRVSK